MSAPAQLADTAEFLYDLPPELIAAHPAKPRGTSRLLVHVPAQPLAGQFANTVDTLASMVSSGGTTLPEGCGTAYDLSFVQLSSVMPRAAHLVFNESRVFAARVRATAASPPTVAIAARIEVLFLSPLSYADPAAALASPADGQLWRAMVRAPLAHRGGTGDGGVGVGRDGFAARLEVRSAETVMQLTVEKVLAPWVEAGEVAATFPLPRNHHYFFTQSLCSFRGTASRRPSASRCAPHRGQTASWPRYRSATCSNGLGRRPCLHTYSAPLCPRTRLLTRRSTPTPRRLVQPALPTA